MKKKIIVLTGAGMSAESGIKTFRDADGLWEGHDVMQVASPMGWHQNAALVLDFYNQRRKQLLQCEPNEAHRMLARLEEFFHIEIITQNVDDLHERAGSTKVLHLHGELLKSRSTGNNGLIYNCHDDIVLGMKCEMGYQLRPHIVWFGEDVPMLEIAVAQIREAEMVLIIGTSLQVYPAAGLISFARSSVPVYYIDPKPASNLEISRVRNLKIFPLGAIEGMKQIYNELLVQD